MVDSYGTRVSSFEILWRLSKTIRGPQMTHSAMLKIRYSIAALLTRFVLQFTILYMQKSVASGATADACR